MDKEKIDALELYLKLTKTWCAERSEYYPELLECEAIAELRGNVPCPTDTVREHCRKRKLLDGANAQALEGALAQAERELRDMRLQLDTANQHVKILHEQPKQVRCGGCRLRDGGCETYLNHAPDGVNGLNWYCADAEERQ